MAAGAQQRAERALRGPIDRLTSRLPKPWRTIVDWGVTIAIAVGAVLLIKTYVINPYRIPSPSMEPTFHCADVGNGCEGDANDRIIANRFVYHFQDPERGQVVVFDPGEPAARTCGTGGTYVKRIVGLPGETVALRDGVVYIDGTALDEPYLDPARTRDDPNGDFAPLTLGDDEYFMLGDNRRMSCDSRVWGGVKRSQLIGPVFFVYWPLDRIGFR